jgi:hypothetical protein
MPRDLVGKENILDQGSRPHIVNNERPIILSTVGDKADVSGT